MKRNGIIATFLATVLMALFAAGSMLHVLSHQADHLYERLTGQYLISLENYENPTPDSCLRKTGNCSGDALQEHFCQLCSQVNPLSAVNTADLLPPPTNLNLFFQIEKSGHGVGVVQIIRQRAPPEELI
ncbi:MAG: hypothetical protein RR060_01685 [Victivallaceae bacterium]